MENIIPEIREKITVPALFRFAGYTNFPDRDGSYLAPYRPEKSPSLSVFGGLTRWRDHALDKGGDVLDLAEMLWSVDKSTGLKMLKGFAGIATVEERPKPQASERPKLVLPPLRIGTAQEHQTIARRRCISPASPEMASRLGALRYTSVCSHECWLLTDAAERIAEARRMDGKPFEGEHGTRKAHTLRGSSKAWPVGVAVLKQKPFRKVMLVEGGPDYLAALHFIIEQGAGDVLPVAMLGRSTGGKIDPDALHLLRDKRVRIYPHNDADGGGMAAAEKWAAQLQTVGCTVDSFTFGGLTRRDGKPVNDLNDAVVIEPSQERELEGILP